MNVKSLAFLLPALFLWAACGPGSGKSEPATTGTAQSVSSADAAQPSSAVGQEPSAADQDPNDAARILAKPEVPVLCYHRLADGAKGDYTVSPTSFKAQMKMLSDSGFHSVSPAQLYDWLVYDRPLPAKPFLVTFDDSRSEHSAVAAPVLEQYGFRGAFFIMTITYGKKNYMTTDQIAALAKAGHTIGLHTWDHTMVTRFKDSTDWRRQLADPQRKLAGIIGQPVEYFAYPNGVFNAEVAGRMGTYFKLSFSLISKRDSVHPLQNVRRMIATDVQPERLLRILRRTFKTSY